MLKETNAQRRTQNEYRMAQENRMKNQIGLQTKKLAGMKIQEEMNRKRQLAQRDAHQKAAEEE